MSETQDILDEYKHESIKHSRFYIPITILFGMFLCFLILGMFINIESLTWHRFNSDWIDILFSLLIPGCGLAFFIAKKRIGWFISTIFLSFIAFAGIATILDIATTKAGFSYLLQLKGRQIFILATSTSASILLQTKSIRVCYQVRNLIWFIAMTISLCFALVLIFFG